MRESQSINQTIKKQEKPTQVVSADLQRLDLPHQKPGLTSFLVLENLHAPCPPLLPLISLLIKSVQFRLPTNRYRRSKTKRRKECEGRPSDLNLTSRAGCPRPPRQLLRRPPRGGRWERSEPQCPHPRRRLSHLPPLLLCVRDRCSPSESEERDGFEETKMRSKADACANISVKLLGLYVGI